MHDFIKDRRIDSLTLGYTSVKLKLYSLSPFLQLSLVSLIKRLHLPLNRLTDVVDTNIINTVGCYNAKFIKRQSVLTVSFQCNKHRWQLLVMCEHHLSLQLKIVTTELKGLNITRTFHKRLRASFIQLFLMVEDLHCFFVIGVGITWPGVGVEDLS